MAVTDTQHPFERASGSEFGNKTEPSGHSASPRNERDRQAATNAGISQLVRDTTLQRLGDQKERATETLDSLAGAVRGMTQQLRDGGQTQVADYVNRAADGIDRWASQLRQQDLEQALRGVQRFARREPALFLGLAFGTGVLVARFLKSSGDGSDSRSYAGEWDGGLGREAGSSTVAASYGANSLPTTSPVSDVREQAAGDRVSADTRSAGEVL